MSMISESIIWHDAKLMSPANDGMYLVNTFGDHYTDLPYTREGGWNTHRKLDGTVSTDARMEVEYWAELPTKKEIIL